MNYDEQGLMIPPSSIEAEQSVLGALLIDNNAIDRIDDLSEEEFYKSSHRIIFRAIMKLAESGKPFDIVTVAEYLETIGKLNEAEGLAYIGMLAQDVPSSANIRRYAEIISEHSIRRKIMAAASELTEIISSKGDIDSALDKAQSQLIAITETSTIDEPRQLSNIVSDHFNTIEERYSGEKQKGISTGLVDLDAILNGGWHRGQVIVIAARPSMGKTALSMHHAIMAASEYNVLIMSMEMVAAELADRALSSLGKISLGNVLTGKLSDEDWPRLTQATSKIQEKNLFIMDKSGLNFYQVATFARRHKRKHGLDVLIVDYLQLMSGDSHMPRHAQIEEITRNLKTLAKELNVAILLLSQLSRKTETTRRPKLSDLRDSGAIEQDADIVLFIHREEVDNPETPWKGYADIHIAKNRQGALGRVGTTYIGSQVRFENFNGTLPDFETKPFRRGMD